MNEKIEHIVEREFDQKLNARNLELVKPLKEYIANGSNDSKRNMAAAVLNNISRYHLLDETFDFLIEQAKKESPRGLRFEFIRHLQGLQSNANSIDFLIEITNKRNVIPKRQAYRAMRLIKHSSIEDHVLEKVKIEKDNGVIEAAITSLTLNGTQKSIEPLINIFKKSRDGSVRGQTVNVLRHIVNRVKLTEENEKMISKFSKKSKLGFENIWTGPPKTIEKTKILQEAEKQLVKNKLNLEFGIDENFKANINIEKMKKDYIRFLTFSIKSLEKPIFFKDIIISSFSTGKGYNYTEFLDKLDQMKLIDYKSEILNIIENEVIPYIFDIHLGAKKVIQWSFEQIKENYQELINNLKIEHEHLELEYFVQFSIYKKNDLDYNEYIKHCLQLWEKVEHFKDFTTREYLLNELKYGR